MQKVLTAYDIQQEKVVNVEENSQMADIGNFELTRGFPNAACLMSIERQTFF